MPENINNIEFLKEKQKLYKANKMDSIDRKRFKFFLDIQKTIEHIYNNPACDPDNALSLFQQAINENNSH